MGLGTRCASNWIIWPADSRVTGGCPVSHRVRWCGEGCSIGVVVLLATHGPTHIQDWSGETGWWIG